MPANRRHLSFGVRSSAETKSLHLERELEAALPRLSLVDLALQFCQFWQCSLSSRRARAAEGAILAMFHVALVSSHSLPAWRMKSFSVPSACLSSRSSMALDFASGLAFRMALYILSALCTPAIYCETVSLAFSGCSIRYAPMARVNCTPMRDLYS